MRRCAAMVEVQRRHAGLLTHGEWTPLAAASRTIAGRRIALAATARRALGAREPLARRSTAVVSRRPRRASTLPASGLAAVVGRRRCRVFGGGERSVPGASRSCASTAPVVRVDAVPDGIRRGARAASARRPLPTSRDRRSTARRRSSRSGSRCHRACTPRRGRAARAARALRDRGQRGDRCRRRTADRPRRSTRRARTRPRPGARLPTEDEWQLAAEAGLLERAEPARLELDRERAHRRPVTRFAILKGGSALGPRGRSGTSTAAPQDPAFSLQLLLVGAGLGRSSRIGFRLAVDL